MSSKFPDEAARIPHPHQLEVDRVLKHGTKQELVDLRLALVGKKAQIESALASDKCDMWEERDALMREGRSSLEASILATNSGDADWRRRAVGAQKITDRHIAQVNARLHALEGNAAREAVLYTGTPAEVTAAINIQLQLNRRIIAMTSLEGRALVIWG